MMSALMTALGWILTFLYSIVNNYGVAIILFTILIKLILFPIDIKQKRSMAKTQKIQPLLMEVQKKYANDKEKLNQITMPWLKTLSKNIMVYAGHGESFRLGDKL